MSSIRPELKFSDDKDQKSFYHRYARLPQKPERTLRVADRGDYYTVLDVDAQMIAERIYKTQSVVKSVSIKIGAETKHIEYLTLSPAVFATVLKTVVIEMGFKVEIYDKMWHECKTASPGNLSAIDEIVNTSDLSSVSVIAALKLVSSVSQGKKIGLSYYDPGNKFIGLAEFVDNELFSNLESILIQLGVKECLIPEMASSGKDVEWVKLKQVIDRCDVVASGVKNSDFNVRSVEQDFVTLTGDEHVLSTNEMSSLEVSQACANALVTYLSLLSDDTNRGTVTVGKYSLEQYMKLDYAAVRALNLFPPPNLNSSAGKTASLFGLLNNCKTAGGSRLLSQWIKQPLVDVDAINKRHLLVKLFFDDMNLRTNLQNDFLDQVPDIFKLVKRINAKNNKTSRLDDVIRLYQMCLKLPVCMDLLNGCLDEIVNGNEAELEQTKTLVQQLFIDPIVSCVSQLETYQAMVEETVDLASLQAATSAGSISSSMVAINPEYDENLSRINTQLETAKKSMETIHEDVADELGVDIRKLKFEDHSTHGWCLRLSRTDSSCIRGKNRFRELSTVKAGVFFTTTELSRLSKEYKALRDEYETCQRGIVNEVVSTAATYSPVFTKLAMAVSKMDVLVSFSHAATFAPVEYMRPAHMYGVNSEKRVFDLKEARHPCLEQQDNMNFISNDIRMEKDKEEFLIITGPNMGGKSTYIRTVGVIALMNQIGCFIPASEGSEIAVVDSILARVGASDSQLKGVSTFMSEMLEMSSILRTATANSLIIVDELGRGTSTYDGFGLAWSISEYISTKVHAFTLFATHFHELTTMAEKIPTIKNLHVVAHVEDVNDDAMRGTNENITLLYKVEPGVSDQSFGIHVAEIVKFPAKIIQMSKRKASELDDAKNEESAAKKAHISDEEVLSGREDLTKLLKKWKAIVEEKGGLQELKSEGAIAELRKLVASSEFKSNFEQNEFLKSVLTL